MRWSVTTSNTEEIKAVAGVETAPTATNGTQLAPLVVGGGALAGRDDLDLAVTATCKIDRQAQLKGVRSVERPLWATSLRPRGN